MRLFFEIYIYIFHKLKIALQFNAIRKNIIFTLQITLYGSFAQIMTMNFLNTFHGHCYINIVFARGMMINKNIL